MVILLGMAYYRLMFLAPLVREVPARHRIVKEYIPDIVVIIVNCENERMHGA